MPHSSPEHVDDAEQRSLEQPVDAAAASAEEKKRLTITDIESMLQPKGGRDALPPQPAASAQAPLAEAEQRMRDSGIDPTTGKLTEQGEATANDAPEMSDQPPLAEAHADEPEGTGAEEAQERTRLEELRAKGFTREAMEQYEYTALDRKYRDRPTHEPPTVTDASATPEGEIAARRSAAEGGPQFTAQEMAVASEQYRAERTERSDRDTVAAEAPPTSAEAVAAVPDAPARHALAEELAAKYGADVSAAEAALAQGQVESQEPEAPEAAAADDAQSPVEEAAPAAPDAPRDARAAGTPEAAPAGPAEASRAPSSMRDFLRETARRAAEEINERVVQQLEQKVRLQVQLARATPDQKEALERQIRSAQRTADDSFRLEAKLRKDAGQPDASKLAAFDRYAYELQYEDHLKAKNELTAYARVESEMLKNGGVLPPDVDTERREHQRDLRDAHAALVAKGGPDIDNPVPQDAKRESARPAPAAPAAAPAASGAASVEQAPDAGAPAGTAEASTEQEESGAEQAATAPNAALEQRVAALESQIGSMQQRPRGLAARAKAFLKEDWRETKEDARAVAERVAATAKKYLGPVWEKAKDVGRSVAGVVSDVRASIDHYQGLREQRAAVSALDSSGTLQEMAPAITSATGKEDVEALAADRPDSMDQELGASQHRAASAEEIESALPPQPAETIPEAAAEQAA